MVAPAAELGDLVVAGDDGEDGGDTAVRERDAGECGHRDRAGDARHDLDLDTLQLAVGELFRAAAEDVGVAALQPDDLLALACELDEEGVDGVLRHGVVSGELADVDDLRAQLDTVGREAVEHSACAEAVRDDHVGLLERAEPAHREEPRIAGPGADEPHLSRPVLWFDELTNRSKGHRAPDVTRSRGASASVVRPDRRRRAR